LLACVTSTLRHADGGQRAAVGVFRLLLLLLRNDNAGCRFQVGVLQRLLLGRTMALVDAARQLVDAERVVDVVRVGADRLVMSGGHHHGQRRHALHRRRCHYRHRARVVLGCVWREWRGRRQAGLRQHARAGQAGQGT